MFSNKSEWIISIETPLFKAFFFKASNAVVLMSVAVTIASFFAAKIEIIPHPHTNSRTFFSFKERVSRNSKSNFVLKVIKGGKTFVGEITNKRKNGEEYTTETHISPVLDEDKNILFFVSIERDISRLKEIDKAKSEFVSVASHALRTPLGIEKWYLEALIEKKY